MTELVMLVEQVRVQLREAPGKIPLMAVLHGGKAFLNAETTAALVAFGMKQLKEYEGAVGFNPASRAQADLVFAEGGNIWFSTESVAPSPNATVVVHENPLPGKLPLLVVPESANISVDHHTLLTLLAPHLSNLPVEVQTDRLEGKLSIKRIDSEMVTESVASVQPAQAGTTLPGQVVISTLGVAIAAGVLPRLFAEVLVDQPVEVAPNLHVQADLSLVSGGEVVGGGTGWNGADVTVDHLVVSTVNGDIVHVRDAQVSVTNDAFRKAVSGVFAKIQRRAPVDLDLEHYRLTNEGAEIVAKARKGFFSAKVEVRLAFHASADGSEIGVTIRELKTPVWLPADMLVSKALSMVGHRPGFRIDHGRDRTVWVDPVVMMTDTPVELRNGTWSINPTANVIQVSFVGGNAG